MPSFYSLLHKEMFRVWKVGFQTLLAPVLTALLYLLIFSHVLSQHIEVYPGVHYTAFLVPGLAMMSVLQNAFANSSSSLIQSKITGNIVFVLLAPIAYWEFFAAYVLASMLRGLVVGVGVYGCTMVCAAATTISHVDYIVRRSWQCNAQFAGCCGRAVGRKIRSARRIPKFYYYAAHLFVWDILFHPFIATILADAIAL